MHTVQMKRLPHCAQVAYSLLYRLNRAPAHLARSLQRVSSPIEQHQLLGDLDENAFTPFSDPIAVPVGQLCRHLAGNRRSGRLATSWPARRERPTGDPGDNWQDHSLIEKTPAQYFVDRPRALTQVIDGILAMPEWASRFRRDDKGYLVGALGHSAGGFSVLALAGGRADPPGFDRPALLKRLAEEIPAFFDKALH